MQKYSEMSRTELEQIREELLNTYNSFKEKGLNLSMARGVPCPQQLTLAEPMLALPAGFASSDKTDCRNYGAFDGIPEAKALMAQIMDLKAEQVFVGGNSSLNLMHDIISFAFIHGLPRSAKPWCREEKVKFLCPSPGYDRHFAITEHLGIEMITVPMNAEGPDMDEVERLIADPQVRGMWCVPKYSNPQGVVYSDKTVKRMAAIKPAAQDFIFMWDNAYAVHDLYPEKNIKLLNFMQELEANNNTHLCLMFASTSKITFAGAGISAIGADSENMAWVKQHMSMQIISYDKLNQLRHTKFFADIAAVKEHMEKHAAILRPKFELTVAILQESLDGLGIASWQKPLGGYFVSLDVNTASAKQVVELMKQAGVVLTGAGATYPYGNDPADGNIRIAPTFPSLEDLKTAMELLCVCVKLCSAESLLAAKN